MRRCPLPVNFRPHSRIPTSRKEIVAAAQLPPLTTLAAKRWLRSVQARVARYALMRWRRKPNAWQQAVAEIGAAHVFGRSPVKPCWSKLAADELYRQLDGSKLAPWTAEVLVELSQFLEFLDASPRFRGASLWRQLRELRRLSMPFRFERLWQEHLPLFRMLEADPMAEAAARRSQPAVGTAAKPGLCRRGNESG